MVLNMIGRNHVEAVLSLRGRTPPHGASSHTRIVATVCSMVQCRLVIVKDNIFQGTVKSMKQKAPGPLKVQAAVDEFEALNTSEQIDWMIHTAKHYPKLLAAVMEKRHKAALRVERGRRKWSMGLGPRLGARDFKGLPGWWWEFGKWTESRAIVRWGLFGKLRARCTGDQAYPFAIPLHNK